MISAAESDEERYLELRQSLEQALAAAKALRPGTQASRDAWQQVAEIELTIVSQKPADTEPGAKARVGAIYALVHAGENTRALALRHAVLSEQIDEISRTRLLELTVSPTSHRRYYLGNFEGALRFQDMVADAMFEHGLSLGNYLAIDRSSSSENRLGMEIKQLRNYRTHLFFEVAERRGPESSEFVASGIYRPDNSWLYTIGDTATLWTFGKKWLQFLCDQGRYEIIDARAELMDASGKSYRAAPTAKGFAMPIQDADRFCDLKLTQQDGRWKKVIPNQ